jgi:hypothetical protein
MSECLGREKYIVSESSSCTLATCSSAVLEVSIPLLHPTAGACLRVEIQFILEYLLLCYGADVRDVSVSQPKFGVVVEDRMGVEGRLLGRACKCTESVDKLFLKLIGEVVLLPEEDYASLRY